MQVLLRDLVGNGLNFSYKVVQNFASSSDVIQASYLFTDFCDGNQVASVSAQHVPRVRSAPLATLGTEHLGASYGSEHSIRPRGWRRDARAG